MVFKWPEYSGSDRNKNICFGELLPTVLQCHNIYNSHHYWPGFSVLIATGVVLFHKPSQTSPNWPWPNLRTNLRLVLSISHWSLVVWDRSAVVGLSICSNINWCLIHAFYSLPHQTRQIGVFSHVSPRGSVHFSAPQAGLMLPTGRIDAAHWQAWCHSRFHKGSIKHAYGREMDRYYMGRPILLSKWWSVYFIVQGPITWP